MHLSVETGFTDPCAQETPDALFATSDDGFILHWYRAAGSIFGSTSAEAVGGPAARPPRQTSAGKRVVEPS